MTSSRNYRWFLVALLWVVCVINYADRQALPAVLPALRKELHFTVMEQGRMLSAFMITYAALAPFAGMATDMGSRRKLIAAALLFWSLATMAVAWCGTWFQVATCRALAGLGETFYYPAAAALISAHHESGTRSRALSWHQSGVYAGSVLGPWLAAWLAETQGWRIGFQYFGLAGIVMAGVLLLAIREPEGVGQARRAVPGLGSFTEFFGSPGARWLALGFAGANFVASMVMSWTPTYLGERFDLKLTAAGLNSALYLSVASAIAVPIAGWLADSWVRRNRAGRIWLQAFGVVAAAACMAAFGQARSFGWGMVAMAGLGVGKGFYDAGIFASLFDVVGPERRATAAGWMNLAGWTGGAAAPAVAAWLVGLSKAPTLGERLGFAMSMAAIAYVLALAGLLMAARSLGAGGPAVNRQTVG
jgi:MFS family permease